jgi:hypothetical protein
MFEQEESGGVMEKASAKPPVKLSFLPSISFKNGPLDGDLIRNR